MSEPWERQPGETPRRFQAFRLYMQLSAHERSVTRVQEQLGLKSNRHLYRWSSAHTWRDRVAAWDDDQARILREATNEQLRDMARRHYNLADHMAAIVAKHLQQQARLLSDQMNSDPGGQTNPLTYLDPKDIPRWIKAIVDTQRVSLGEPIVIPMDADEERSRHWGPIDSWRQQYVQPPGSFSPHRLQRDAINSLARFCAIVAGVQSGKTTAGAISFWNRILNDRDLLKTRGEQGLYWMVAPNSVIGRVMMAAFEKLAPDGHIVGVKGSESSRVWTLASGARVEFRSAQVPTTLVAAGVNGVWLDEFTLMDSRVWTVSLRQRLAKTAGWVLFTGTPRGRNWAYEEIWRRGLPDDDLYDREYECFTWPSSANPAISTAELASAKRQLPDAYYRREWEASWEAFHGQIWEYWNRARHWRDLREHPAPNGTRYFMGVDWGIATPGAAVVGRWLPSGEWHILEEVHQAGKLSAWWREIITALWRKWKVIKIYCDPEDPGRILELAEDGLPAVKANNEVHEGIRTVAALYRQDRLYVDKTCQVVAKQTGDYHWAEDSRGNRREHPHKENDHTCLAGETLVLTDSGPVPIERVLAGDLVWTRRGLQEVVWSGCTGRRETVELEFTHGRSLIATPDHPILTGRGWIRADGIRYDDKIAAWPTQNPSCSMASSSPDTPSLKGGLNGSTSGATPQAGVSTCTPRSGRMSMDKCRPDITSTTATSTRSTTRSGTLSASRLAITLRCIQWLLIKLRRTASISSRFAILRPRGTAHPMARSGTSTTDETRMPRESQEPTRAPIVVRRTRPQLSDRSSVRGSAGRLPGGHPVLTTKSGGVDTLSVARHSPSTGTPRSSIVLGAVRLLRSTPVGERRVFNLAVARAPEFVAEGILLHNCDGKRYMIHSAMTEPAPGERRTWGTGGNGT